MSQTETPEQNAARFSGTTSCRKEGREHPLLFMFEEAHAYLGHSRPPAVQTAVQTVVNEGQKYGVGTMVVSQRPSEVDATILSQCGTIIALRLSNAASRPCSCGLSHR